VPREIMLHFWKGMQERDINNLGYRTAVRDDGAGASPGDAWRFPRKGGQPVDNSPSWRRDSGGGSKKGGNQPKKDKETLKAGANSWASRVKASKTAEEELARNTRSLLNKICPENTERITERLAETQVNTIEEMELVISIIFGKVTDDPHYCETYVDMIHRLQKAYPEFPPSEDGQQPCTFRRMLVNQCQDKFEIMMEAPEIPESIVARADEQEIKDFLIKQKRASIATMKFIGYLFLRQLLAAAVIRQVVGDLLNNEPPEMQVEYALELLQVVGKRFEETDKDKAQLSIILDRLNALKKQNGSDGKALLSKRVCFKITDLVDLRSAGWKEKGFKEVAKKIEEVHEQADREERAEQANSRNRGGHGGGGGYRGHR